jgi:hypothetical protein
VRGADLALMLLSLALVVACVGAAYRYLTSSITRLYAKSLDELLGPWAELLMNSPRTADLRIRGPFQFTNILPPKMQLPLSRDEFITAFERITPGLYGEALAILSRDDPHKEWGQFIERLKAAQDSYEAQEIVEISKSYDHADFSRIRSALWQLYPDVNNLISRYNEFLPRVEYANRRRNFRQFTVIAGLLTFCGNLTLSRLFDIGGMQHGSPLIDTYMLVALPHMIWQCEFVGVLSYVAACLLSALTIAGLADVLDRKLFGPIWMNTLAPPIDHKTSERMPGDKT